jgi:hypothetical protein
MSNELLQILLAAKLTVVGCALTAANAPASETQPAVQSQTGTYEVVATTSPTLADRAAPGQGGGGGAVCC